VERVSTWNLLARGTELSSRRQSLAALALLVDDYDRAIAYYTEILGFRLIEDTPQGPGKRFVRVAPANGPNGGDGETALLLAKAAKPEQIARIGDQTGGRVFLFLHTDDFWRDYATYKANGVDFTEQPREETYGTVVVFRDIYGNLWDLVQRR
jgi:catechol 2,3-dioxygenase-like lactoylglutathione lyase family enzyme